MEDVPTNGGGDPHAMVNSEVENVTMTGIEATLPCNPHGYLAPVTVDESPAPHDDFPNNVMMSNAKMEVEGVGGGPAPASIFAEEFPPLTSQSVATNEISNFPGADPGHPSFSHVLQGPSVAFPDEPSTFAVTVQSGGKQHGFAPR